MAKKPVEQKPEILQDHQADVHPGWTVTQEALASASGLSLLLVEGHQPPAILIANNNSICQALQSSPEHVKLCDPYCGEAHQRALDAGRIRYKCHAGLNCFAQPVQIGKRKDLAVIGGRAFAKTTDYDSLVERFRSGDLQALLTDEVFRNIVFAEPQQLEDLAESVSKATATFATVEQNGSKDIALVQRPRPVAPEAPRNELEREVERLRGELEYRTHFTESLQNFAQRISSSSPAETYRLILNHLKELMQAERASLFVFDPVDSSLVLRVADGLPVDTAQVGPIRLGTDVAGQVMESGEPMLVTQAKPGRGRTGRSLRRYKSNSFISYPLIIGGRKIGVLNLAEKAAEGSFNQVDLTLLELLAPQVALAVERAEWQERATEFQLMSITDPLTGLLNRRYLEERLNEELNRSKRYAYEMSFLMIDIDDFKSYNDLNGHQAGDMALQLTAHCLKAGLRAADVAARYGGEEFSVLLPQTSLDEAGVIAERMRERVASTNYAFGKRQPLGQVTISIGVSTAVGTINTAERVIAAADRALYNAKNQGKNRVEFYQEKSGS